MTPIRQWCTICTERPVAMRGVRFCFDCWPGGPVIPPPCLRCGAINGYYSSGLCDRCHPYRDPGIDSCRDCHAWGATRTYRWLCRGCANFRRKNPTIGRCPACGRRRNLGNRGACRLCFKQAGFLRKDHRTLDVLGANRDGQQLFFADMFRRNGTRRPVVAPPTTVLPARITRSRQLTLFEARRDLTAQRRTVLRHRADPVLAAHLTERARTLATELGWSTDQFRTTRYGLEIVLGLRDDDGPIKASTVELLPDIRLPVWTVLRVLADADMLDDDRVPAFDAWGARQLQDLPEPMATELRTWFQIMRDGSPTPPRRRPRSRTTIEVNLRRALPILRGWVAEGRTSLREITTHDVLEALPPSGDARAWAGEGLRSIFQLLKQHRVLFADPTRRIKIGPHGSRQPLPVNLDLLRAALNSDNPTQAAIAALIAFHGLQVIQLQNLRLTDIRDHRLHVDSRVIVLASHVRERLRRYLDYRAQRWPNTANPYLLVNYRTINRTIHVGRRWVWTTLGPGLSATAVREDRILDEAHATRGDVRRLADLFGLGIEAGARYTATIGHPDLAANEQN